MPKKEHYGLEFTKQKLSNGEIFYRVDQKLNGNINNVILNFIYRLNEHQTKSFINDLNRCISSQANVDEGFFSDSVEDMEILYQYPNVDINDILKLPMVDLKEILEEWLEFISST
ncbi:hypothetical protein G6M26_23420 [Agrobacterium tumefaciens]|nr:hypothetical protein [Agrobacterium tumefaciens]NTE21494.1 hypothetical protein [Agrobacterium tumefaciens]